MVQAQAPNKTFDLTELAQRLGPDGLETAPQALADHEIDELQPSAVVRPQSVDEVTQAVKWAFDAGAAVSPWGGGTKQSVGRPLNRLDVVLRTNAINRVLEIDSGNLTADVECGLALAELQAQLAPIGLFVPLDPMNGAAATIGGLIATNASGPRRLLHRTARDQVLGLQVVLPDGTLLRAGGKTVKDVAGYNLTKPMIGSWGTLGVIVGATVRLLPLPEASRQLLVRTASLESAANLAMAVRGSQLLPAGMEVCSEVAGTPARPTPAGLLMFYLEGHREAVDRMSDQVAAMAAAAGGEVLATMSPAEAAAFWGSRLQAEVQMRLDSPDTVVTRVSVPMAGLGTALSSAVDLARRSSVVYAVTAHAGNGIARITFAPAEGAGAEAVATAVRGLREVTTRLGGFTIVERAPVALKRAQDALPARDDYALMKAVREALNPRDTLNPGKLV